MVFSSDKDLNGDNEKQKNYTKPIYLKDYEREQLLKKGR